MGDVSDFTNFMGAVIDEASYAKLKGAIEGRAAIRSATILAGGECDDREGWFIRPTLIKTEDPKHELMSEELFGPVVTLYVYPDADYEETLRLVDSTSPYALTGAVFSTDRARIARAHDLLRHAAGNFYINDKPTGAVVGQQPSAAGRGVGHQRQGGLVAELAAVGEREDGQGDAGSAEGSSVSVPRAGKSLRNGLRATGYRLRATGYVRIRK
jgi:1-pyrroline-5-carboxylate dehydrogenase